MAWSPPGARSSCSPPLCVLFSHQVARGADVWTCGAQEMIVNIMRVRQGFLTVGPRLEGGPEEFFENVSESTFVIKSCLYNAQTLILDAVVVSHTYSRSPGAISTSFSPYRSIARTLCGKIRGLSCCPSSDGVACSVSVTSISHRGVHSPRSSLAVSIGLNIALATASHAGDVFAVGTGRWITANYSITLATNLSSTSKCGFDTN